jgi:PAS domain S-box-containing protein
MNKKNTISTRKDTILRLKALAKKKESVRSMLVVTAEGKEDIRSKLAVTAKQLAVTAEEKERVRNKLATTAKELAATAKEKENIRRRLVVTAEELKLKAKNLAVIAEEKESIRLKLEVTAKNLATTAKEKEDIRKKLEVTAEELKLKAKNLAVIAEEKESIRLKLKTTAENLATTAKEKEDIRKKLEVTAEELALTAKKIDAANKYSRSLIEASLDPLVTISPEGKVTDVNEATIKITGVLREQLTGSDFSSYFTEPEKASEGYQKVLKEGSITDYPLTIKAHDGRLTDVLYNASVYKDIGGNVLGVLAVARDVTEQKVLQRSKDEFFSIASHELRTPLTAIKGNTAMIEQFYGEKLKDPELKGMISDIHESSDRLIGIVNDFLDLSRLEQGKIKFNSQPINTSELIENVLKELTTTSMERKLSLEYKKDPKTKPSIIFADPDKVKQVLINLIGNSLKSTEKGGVTITTQILPGFLKILISDTGKGIPVANQSLLFHKFQQVGSSILTRDASKGTGLGLYISKLIVEGMGGQIKLESSEADKGSTFSFTLPIATTDQVENKSEVVKTEVKVDGQAGLTGQGVPDPTKT